MLESVPVEARGAKLQALYDEVLEWVYPLYTPRRPKARLVRLLAAMFPRDMTCLMDAARVPGVQRLLGTSRAPGDFVAQHPMLRSRIREIVGSDDSVEAQVDQSIFAWFLWQTQVDRQDEGAVPVQPLNREANALPPLSLLPAHAQRRSLACVRDNIGLLMAMVREAEQGITREDLVGVILTEATQLNASSAANIISQAMGGLGLIRLDGNAYRPTERGQELLNAGDPAPVLRAPLVGRVFGMGHLLLMINRESAKLRPTDAARKLQDLVPTWTSTLPGSHILAWARLTGLVQLDESPGGGRLVLTDEGADYLAALPEDFEDRWRIEPAAGADLDDGAARTEPSSSRDRVSAYSVADIVAEGCFLSESEVEAAVGLVRRKKNLILQGPPGTGKTWLAKRIGYALIGASDPDRLMAVQFQPSLSYEDFVRGWRPDGQGGLALADGAFLDAVAAARDDPKRPFVIVIEEINRGNPAQILGELLTLIEDTKRSPQEALRLAYPRTLDERIHIPENLYLIGTMNLADRSLALVDLALRRRFAFLTLRPQLGPAWRSWCGEQGAPPEFLDGVANRLLALNRTIEEDRTLGSQFQIGHSFVTPMTAPGPSAQAWHDWYRTLVETEIGPLLFEYWYDDIAQAEAQVANLQF
ncbi:MAG TPA: AAA family ATPase [Allosphingosinicella sp.]|nr:AAA family ATPase [Allosphingosinicella sp.]